MSGTWSIFAWYLENHPFGKYPFFPPFPRTLFPTLSPQLLKPFYITSNTVCFIQAARQDGVRRYWHHPVQAALGAQAARERPTGQVPGTGHAR